MTLALDYQSVDYAISLAQLKRWGKWVKEHRYQVSVPSCNLGRLVDLGVRIEPVIYENSGTHRFEIMQTQRVWAFLPCSAQKALYLRFTFGFKQQRCAVIMGVTPQMFNYYLNRGIELYIKHRDTPFSALDS